MKIKEKLREAVRMYFILFTLISVLLMILGLAFDSDRALGYEVFISPMLYAAIGIIPIFFFKEGGEVSMKKLIVHRMITLGFVEAVILILAFSASSIPTEKKGVVIGIAIGIAVVFALSLLIEYVLELGEARSINKALAEYQTEAGMRE